MSTHVLSICLGAALSLGCSALAQAHPLGNNTVNRAAAISVGGAEVNIAYQLDLAEIPTLLASQAADRDGDGKVLASEWSSYAEIWAHSLLSALRLDNGATPLALQLGQTHWELVDGAAELMQLRLSAQFRAAAPPLARATLHYADRSHLEQAGWREVWVSAKPGATIRDTSAARRDRSAGLTRFPSLGSSPLPNETEAMLTVEFGLPVLALPEAATRATTPHASSTASTPAAWALFKLGVHHIATGWDHLVFLLGLLLLSQSLRELLAIVTAFTLAHSLTLGLAAGGLVTPPGMLIEPAIALTIAYVGLCNLFFRGRGHGLPLAFGFGLIHGFGFAGALAETLGAHGTRGPGWLWDLAAFNLGIESFQVLLLCALVPLLRYMRTLPGALTLQRAASYGVCGAGLSWFVMRLGGAA